MEVQLDRLNNDAGCHVAVTRCHRYESYMHKCSGATYLTSNRVSMDSALVGNTDAHETAAS